MSKFRSSMIYRYALVPVLIFLLKLALAFFEPIIPEPQIDEIEDLLERAKGHPFRMPERIARMAKHLDRAEQMKLFDYAKELREEPA